MKQFDSRFPLNIAYSFSNKFTPTTSLSLSPFGSNCICYFTHEHCSFLSFQGRGVSSSYPILPSIHRFFFYSLKTSQFFLCLLFFVKKRPMQYKLCIIQPLPLEFYYNICFQVASAIRVYQMFCL